MKTALIIVDVQHDFISGSLAVPNGASVIDEIERYFHSHRPDVIVATRDWHPTDHCSFSENPEFVDGSWPVHCVQHEYGAEIHNAILDLNPVIASKGMYYDKEAYSGFEGIFDRTGDSLYDYLTDRKVRRVVVVGLALDYCVRATALDAAKQFETQVYLPGTMPVSPETGLRAISDLVSHGVCITG